MKLEFLAEAKAEFCVAAVYYKDKERGLGKRFRVEVEDVCSAILEHPLIWREREGLFLRFDDGSRGEVDLSALAGRGVFAAWLQAGVFRQVRVTEFGAVEWPGEIDLCPDSLYLQLSGRTPEEMFPNLRSLASHA